MIKLPHEELVSLAGTQWCSEHKKPVNVVWHSIEKCWTLICHENHYPDNLIQIPTETEEHRQGTLPGSELSAPSKKVARRQPMGTTTQLTVDNLRLLPHTDLATGETLSLDIIQTLVAYAEKYELDPYRGHVAIMYGKPYITIDGYLWYANLTRQPYRLKTRPLTAEERANFRIGEQDHAWLAEIELVNANNYFSGLGIVTQAEMTEMSKKDRTKLRSPVVAAHPWQLAQKRAEWQALRRAFPIGETKNKDEEVKTHDQE